MLWKRRDRKSVKRTPPLDGIAAPATRLGLLLHSDADRSVLHFLPHQLSGVLWGAPSVLKRREALGSESPCNPVLKDTVKKR